MDGNTNTTWGTFSPASGFWIIVDLGSIYTIGSIRVNTSSAGDPDGAGSCYPRSINVLTSTTSTDPVSGFTLAGSFEATQNDWTDYSFSPVAARYVLLSIQTIWPGGGENAADVAELEVFTPNAAPTISGTAPHSFGDEHLVNPAQVSAWMAGLTTGDTDGNTVGIAITGTTGNGTWRYSIDSQATYTALPAVSDTSALLLRPSDWISYTPDLQNGETITLTVRGWDQTTGSAGSSADISINGGWTAFSTGTATISSTIAAINDAPTLSGGPFILTGTNEDTASSGTLISTILAGLTYADVDSGAQSGIAVFGKTGNGTWQYSTDGTSGWTSIGSPTVNSGVLLASSTYIRYVPNGHNGETATLSFSGWDRTTGAPSANGSPATADPTPGGGTTAFSTGTAQASITVASVNDAPIIGSGTSTLTATIANVASTPKMVNQMFSDFGYTDVDLAAQPGIAVTAKTGLGTWEYSVDAVTWTSFGAVSDSAALLLDSDSFVRYTGDGSSGETATFTFRAWDRTSGTASTYGTPCTADTTTNGGTSAFSTGTAMAQISVSALNHAPTMSGGGHHSREHERGYRWLQPGGVRVPDELRSERQRRRHDGDRRHRHGGQRHL
ncbi:MAG TPA: discoidin domain-containing protein, partial [Chloroflexota bacterium]|nr:discoidin domain-containing protein [Chloroflexota bacterium]